MNNNTDGLSDEIKSRVLSVNAVRSQRIMSKPKKRQWNDKYVAYGFTLVTERDGTQKPQCMSCNKIFCNENLKPSKLSEHYQSVHGGDAKSAVTERFKSKRIRFDAAATLQAHGFVPIQQPLLDASYKVSTVPILK